MVFVSNDNFNTIDGTLKALQSSMGPISVRDRGVLGGEHYFSARIEV